MKNDNLSEVVLRLSAKNPFPRTDENYYALPMYLIIWLRGKINTRIVSGGRPLGPYEGNNLTQIIAHWLGLPHGEVIDKIKELE